MTYKPATPDEAFFNAHATATPVGDESPRDAQHRYARSLDAAETVLSDGPFFVWWEPDDETLPEEPGVPVWQASLYHVDGVTEPEHIVTLRGIQCEERSPRLRVVAAELAYDYLPDPPTGDPS